MVNFRKQDPASICRSALRALISVAVREGFDLALRNDTVLRGLEGEILRFRPEDEESADRVHRLVTLLQNAADARFAGAGDETLMVIHESVEIAVIAGIGCYGTAVGWEIGAPLEVRARIAHLPSDPAWQIVAVEPYWQAVMRQLGHAVSSDDGLEEAPLFTSRDGSHVISGFVNGDGGALRQWIGRIRDGGVEVMRRPQGADQPDRYLRVSRDDAEVIHRVIAAVLG